MTTKKIEAAAVAAMCAAHQHVRISEVVLLSGREHGKVLRDRFARASVAVNEALALSGVDQDSLAHDDRGILQSVLWAGTNPAKGTFYDQAVRASAGLADHLATLSRKAAR
jgi:hypothetical protein